MKYAVAVAACVALIIPVITMIKKKCLFKNLFISAFQGIAALLAVNALGLLTGITIAVNWYTVAASVCLGIPACISMLILNIFL